MRNSLKTSRASCPQQRRGPIITIDGPAASGKSTTARLAAKRLGYLYLDTGAMYRALTWKALRDKVDMGDEKALSHLAEQTQVILSSQSDGKIKICVDGKDVTSSIRSPEVDKFVSFVSSIKEVREKMVHQQRKMGMRGKVVAEGRDMGTVVFPEAEVKMFLEASLKERARRRWEERKEKGLILKREEVEVDLTDRDRMDTQRKISPLRKAQGAIIIDNTHLTISQTVDRVLWVARECLTKREKHLFGIGSCGD